MNNKANRSYSERNVPSESKQGSNSTSNNQSKDTDLAEERRSSSPNLISSSPLNPRFPIFFFRPKLKAATKSNTSLSTTAVSLPERHKTTVIKSTTYPRRLAHRKTSHGELNRDSPPMSPAAKPSTKYARGSLSRNGFLDLIKARNQRSILHTRLVGLATHYRHLRLAFLISQ
jgi:hypothetical protein